MWEVELLSSRLEDVGTCKNIVLPTGGMALPRSHGTVNSGAHNTVDAQRHMGGLTVRVLTGTYNTVEVNSGAYNTVYGRAVVKYCSTGYGLWYRGLTCEPCLAFLRTPPGSFRADVPDRMAPVGSGAPVGE